MPKPLSREDEVTLRMLKTKPKPHAPLKAKAKPSRVKPTKGGSAGHLPQRAAAVSGKAGRTPETPPKKAKKPA